MLNRKNKINKESGLEKEDSKLTFLIILSYLSLIIWSAIAKIMKEKNLFKSFTISEVLYELKKLRIVEMIDGRRYLTEISKTQRFLYQQFNISIPVGT